LGKGERQAARQPGRRRHHQAGQAAQATLERFHGQRSWSDTAGGDPPDAGNERPETFAAKRWVPWLCAYTGARVGELAQLRKEDIQREGKHWTITITPDAGTVKNNEARTVVLHPHLIELGFIKFVQAAPSGHLFIRPSSKGDVLGPLQGLKNRLAEFARAVVPDRNVAPNHGWRHRFKTVGIEAGIEHRILDAIQGQRPRNVAEGYGEVTIKTQAGAIAKLPRYRPGR
jgi:integrase